MEEYAAAQREARARPQPEPEPDFDVEHGQEQQKQQEEMAQYAEQLRARKEAEAGGERVQTTAERMAAEQAQREEGGAVGKLEGQVSSPQRARPPRPRPQAIPLIPSSL